MLEKVTVGQILAVAVALAVALVGLRAYEKVSTLRTERACLRAGWPRADWRWIGPSYCIRRVNQTDVVVPLDSAARRQP